MEHDDHKHKIANLITNWILRRPSKSKDPVVRQKREAVRQELMDRIKYEVGIFYKRFGVYPRWENPVFDNAVGRVLKMKHDKKPGNNKKKFDYQKVQEYVDERMKNNGRSRIDALNDAADHFKKDFDAINRLYYYKPKKVTK
jgi:hypothetical protein